MFRILSLSGRDAYQFDALEGRRNDAHSSQHAAPAVRHETAVFPEVAETDGDTGIAETEEDDGTADDEHDDDGDDFDEGEPEFKFPVILDGRHVGNGDDGHPGQGRYPLRQQGEPIVDVNADSRDFRKADGDPQEPIRAGRKVADKGADILMAVGCKRAGDRFLIKHFTHDTHDKEHDDAGYGITDED